MIKMNHLSEVMKSDGRTNIMCHKSGFMTKAMNKPAYINCPVKSTYNY